MAARGVDHGGLDAPEPPFSVSTVRSILCNHMILAMLLLLGKERSDAARSEREGPSERGYRPGDRSGSFVRRRIVALLLSVVLSGDVAALVVRRDQIGSGRGRDERAASVLFRDDFSGGTAFSADEGDLDGGVREETFRLLTEHFDVYVQLPPDAPERPRILQTQDVSVAVDVQSVSSDADAWVGIFCRFGGFGTDAYVANVRPDGSWAIVRTTIGDEYVKRVLGGGRAQGIISRLPAGFAVHLRLDCLGRAETTLVLSVNDVVIGTATDPSGLGPGNVGMAGSSTAGLIFDNLVVTEIN